MSTGVTDDAGMPQNMTAVSGNVALMSGNLTHIATDTGEGTQSMRDMLVRLDKMNTTMAVIAVPMYQIRNDMGHMSKNMQHVAGPMKMVPW